MLWFTLWFTIALKIPALYLAYVIWWSVKDPPPSAAGNQGGAADGGLVNPPARGPRVPAPGRRDGPHGSPERRPSRTSRTPARAGRTR